MGIQGDKAATWGGTKQQGGPWIEPVPVRRTNHSSSSDSLVLRVGIPEQQLQIKHLSGMFYSCAAYIP